MSKYDISRTSPFEATHAGDLVKDEMAARGITLSDLAGLTGLQKPVLDGIIRGVRSVSPGMALIFEDTIGIPATLLLNVQIQYRMDCARIEWARHAQAGSAVERTPENAQPVMG